MIMNIPAWVLDPHRCEFCLQAWGEHEQTCPYHPTPAWDRDNPIHDHNEDKDRPPERWRDRL